MSVLSHGSPAMGWVQSLLSTMETRVNYLTNLLSSVRTSGLWFLPFNLSFQSPQFLIWMESDCKSCPWLCSCTLKYLSRLCLLWRFLPSYGVRFTIVSFIDLLSLHGFDVATLVFLVQFDLNLELVWFRHLRFFVISICWDTLRVLESWDTLRAFSFRD